MAEISDEQLNAIRRALADVSREVQSSEKAFGVADLGKTVADLAKVRGDQSAWKITYDTSGLTSIEKLAEEARIGGGQMAWKITYDTK